MVMIMNEFLIIFFAIYSPVFIITIKHGYWQITTVIIKNVIFPRKGLDLEFPIPHKSTTGRVSRSILFKWLYYIK